MRRKTVRNLDSREIAERFDSQFTYDNVPIRKLLIANIPQDTTHKELKKQFTCYGKIENCILKKRQKHGKSYAFVTYSSDEDSVKARRAGELWEISINGQYLRVLPANSWNQPESIRNRKEIDESPEELCDNDELDKVFDSKCTIDDEETAIHKLNDDCLFHIFMYLSVYNRIKIERVCKRWKAVSRELWRSFKNLDFTDYKFFKVKHDNYHSSADYNDYSCCSIRNEFKALFLYHILRRSGDFITNINLYCKYWNLSKSTIIMIVKLCPNVQSIKFSYMEANTAGIKALAQNCTNIKILQIKHLYTENSLEKDLLVANTLSRLFTKNKSLQCLELHDELYGIKCLYSLPHKSVKEISLRTLSETSIPCLSKIIQKFQSLRVLKLNFCMENAIDCTALKTSIETHAKSLTVLEISYFRYSRINVIPIVELRNLEDLNVTRSDFVDDEFLMTLSATCKLLTSLNISACRSVTNLGLSNVASLPNLLHLDVSHLNKITDEVFGNMTTLKALNCSNCRNVYNAGLMKLIAMANDLETLNLNHSMPLEYKELFGAAAESTKYRINNKILKITTTYLNPEEHKWARHYAMVSPFLNIC